MHHLWLDFLLVAQLPALAAKSPAVEHTIGDLVRGAAEMIGALTVLGGALWWLVGPRINAKIEAVVQKVNETHHNITVNGGKSNPPTFRDEVSILRRQVSAVTEQAAHFAEDMTDLREDMTEVREDLHGLTRSLATNTADTRDVKDALDKHLKSGERYLGKVEVVLNEHGIELPPADDE